MIENYVHWNEDIGEWQLVSSLCLSQAHTVVCSLIDINVEVQTLFSYGILLSNVCLCTVSYNFQKCVAYTGNNMRKQTPAPDKKEKDVSFL